MKRYLEKISWETRKFHLIFNLITLKLNDHFSSWGINFFTIIKNHNSYSLFSFEFKLPNKTNIPKFRITKWDILFLRTPLFLVYEDLCEKNIWGDDLSQIDKINLNILERLFR